MTHNVEVDFRQNLLKSRGPNVEDSKAWKKCYQFEIKCRSALSPESVPIVPVKIANAPWLFGPATHLETRRIIYPCTRFKCSVPCPCLLCSKQHPTCRAPNSDACSCHDCTKHFSDHSSYHCSYHYGCKFCFQLVKTIPNFNFFFLDMEKKKFPAGKYDYDTPTQPHFRMPDHKLTMKLYDMWLFKRANWTKDRDDGGMWCKDCNLLYWTFEDLRHHLKTCHMVSKIFHHHCRNTAEEDKSEKKCYQCSVSFATKTDLRRHIDSIHLQESYNCDVCGADFSRKDNYMRHKSTKHKNVEDLKFSCDECGNQFQRPDILQRHMRVVHSSNNSSFQCDLCNTAFNRETSLKRHTENIYTKEGNPKYVCHLCPEIFCSKSSLTAHIKSSHEINPGNLEKQEHVVQASEVHSCFFCGKSFGRKGNLINHKKLAHKDNSFGLNCLLCHTNFKYKMNLERHQKEIYNEGIAKNVCEYCSKQFCTSKRLRAHVNSKHSHFVCEFCDQSFINSSNLALHVKKRMKQSLSCNICNKSLCNPRSLKVHMKSEQDE